MSECIFYAPPQPSLAAPLSRYLFQKPFAHSLNNVVFIESDCQRHKKGRGVRMRPTDHVSRMCESDTYSAAFVCDVGEMKNRHAFNSVCNFHTLIKGTSPHNAYIFHVRKVGTHARRRTHTPTHTQTHQTPHSYVNHHRL